MSDPSSTIIEPMTATTMSTIMNLPLSQPVYNYQDHMRFYKNAKTNFEYVIRTWTSVKSWHFDQTFPAIMMYLELQNRELFTVAIRIMAQLNGLINCCVNIIDHGIVNIDLVIMENQINRLLFELKDNAIRSTYDIF